MKSKGPVDFFLGVFLEFGAAFCLLFFLPQFPWHWAPGEREPASKTQVSPSRLISFAATQRRVSLLPSQPALTRTDLSLLATRRDAPPLLPSETDAPDSDTVQFSESTIGQAAPESTRRATSYDRREFPRRYQY